MRLRNRLFVALVAACVFAASVLAQPAHAGTTGAIDGVVSDVDGHPIGEVQVAATAPSYTTKTVTGANGFYALNGLPLDTYVVSFSKTGYQTNFVSGVTISQDQTRRVDVVLQVHPKTIGLITVRSTTSLVQPNVTSSSYVVNSRALEDINGTPQDLNGFQAFNALPGVTTDNAGYPTIRAGAENDVGYQLDGIDNTDPVTGQFLNAVTLNGARSVQLATGGYDVATGNTNSGVINEVIRRGAYPGTGQATFRIGFQPFDHEISADYGSATPDNRFSYYASFGGQRNTTVYGNNADIFPLNLGFQDYNELNDFIGNFFYRWGGDNRNELQFLTNLSGETLGFSYLILPKNAPYSTLNGNVQAGTDLLGIGLPLSNYTVLFPGQAAVNQFINSVDTQTFNSTIDKLNYKRQFGPSSFGDFTLFRTSENLVSRYPYNFGSFTDTFQDLNTVGLGVQADYDNQINGHHELGFGGTYTYYTSLFKAAFPSFQPFAEPLEGIGCQTGAGGCYIGPLNAALNSMIGTTLPTGGPFAPMTTFADSTSYTDAPIHRYDLYAKDRWQPNDNLTVTFGVRYDLEVIGLPADAAAQNLNYYVDDAGNYITNPPESIGANVTRPSQLSPRIAVSWQLGHNDVVRASYGKNIEFEPISAVQNSYRINPSFKSCDIPSGCFTTLPGYSATCVNGVDPANSNALCNGISNLYQQLLADLNTNNFASFTPVMPQRAVNYDFSYEHDFGKGLDLKITPYYRRGTDYVVTNSNLILTLPSGTAVFGPARSVNAGVNSNTGVELELQKQAQYGFSGFLDATYDNTLANYDSDFFPSVNSAALAANHFFHVTYIAPVIATLVVAYDSRRGFHASLDVPYESGYPYGVGTKTFVFMQCGLVPGCTGDPNANVPTQVLNTDLAATTPSQAYYFTDPANPGTMLNPNIVASRGTKEGPDPGSLHGPQTALFNMSVSQDVGHGPNNVRVGLRVLNLLGNYSTYPHNNPYYVFNGMGGYGPGSGVNTNACPPGVVNQVGCEPFQNNYTPFAYENEASGQTRVFTFFVNMHY
jgi:outer membrane receptor protein involved in Fe transport